MLLVRKGWIGLMATVLLPALPARADLAPPNTAGCQGKSVGAVCKTDGSATGSCAQSTCTGGSLPYWDKDTLANPPSRSYNCLKCVVGVANSEGTCRASPVAGARSSVVVAGLLAGASWAVRRRRSA